MQQQELDDLLAEEEIEINDASNVEIDDILNESDPSIKDLDEGQAKKILSEKKSEKKLVIQKQYNKELYQQLIRKYIENDFETKSEEFIVEIASSDEQEIIEEDSQLEKIDQQERFTKKVQLEHIQLMSNLQLNNLEIHGLQGISQQLKQISGQPCILTYQCDIMLIGTSSGEILVYCVTSTDQFGSKVLRYKSKVCALDNTTQLLLAGYEDNKIILWDPNSRAQLKIFENQSPLIAIKFCNDTKFIMSDFLGNVYFYKIQKLLWSYQIDGDKLLPRNIHPFYQIQINNQKYVALACLEYILVINLEPQPNIIKRIIRVIDELTYPMLSWGTITNTEGYTETIDTALSVSWGTHIEIYTLDQIGMNQKYSFILNGILCCNWISRDMLIVIDKEFNLITLNVQFFNPDQISQELRNTIRESPNFISNRTNKAIQSNYPLNDMPCFPIQFNTGKQKISVFTNCIFGNSRFIYFLTLPMLKRVKLLTWSDYMKKLIEQADTQQSWYDILSFGLKLYWNQIHCFALQSNDQHIVIADISKDICGSFLNLVGQKIEEQRISENLKYQQWDHAIMAAIQYCIECNQQQYLFTGLKQILTRFHRYTQFLTSLEPFILNGQIKSLPNELLMQLSTHYKVLNKPETVQQLILCLDPTFLDMTTIFQICQENDLYTPLIVVCPRIDNDYITPLQKMYAKFLTSQCKEMLLKCLWFMKLTFKKIMFPNQIIQQDIFLMAFSQILMWLLLEDIFHNFAVEYPKELFEILKIAIKDASNFVHPHLNKYFNNQKPIIVAFIHRIYTNLQQTIVTHESVAMQFSIFIGSLKHIGIREDILLKSLKYLIKERKNFTQVMNIIENIQLQQSTLDEFYKLCQDNYIQALFTSDIIQQIDLCLKNDFNKKYFLTLIHKSLKTKRKQTIIAITNYLEKLLGNNHTLPLMKSIIEELTITEQYNLLNRDVCDGYLDLFQQLNPRNKELRQLYIKACCIHNPNQVLDKIQHFPLDELEEIFLETKHKEGLGYIYAKVGKFKMAMNFFIQNILEYLEQCFQTQSFQSEILNLKFDLLFQACKDSLNHDGIDLFLIVAQELFNSQTYTSFWEQSELIDLENYNSMIPLLQTINLRLCELYNNLKIDDLIKLVEKEVNIFSMLWIKWSFKSLVYNSRIDLFMMSKCFDIQFKQYWNNKELIFREYASSPQYQNICCQCQQILGDELNQHILLRRCPHTTHQNCLSLPFCEFCVPKVRLQLDKVIANKFQNDRIDQKQREILIKESQHFKKNREIEESIEDLQLTAEEIKGYEEYRLIHDLELFDYYSNL